MKYLIFILSICVTSAFADQRMETAGGYSHFQLDPNNADNEIYFSNCESTIETANGVAEGRTVCKVKGATSIPWAKYTTVIPTGTNLSVYGLNNEACTMVTSNYNNNTDSWNQTEYNTNDSAARYVAVKKGTRYNITYTLTCSNGAQ